MRREHSNAWRIVTPRGGMDHRAARSGSLLAIERNNRGWKPSDQDSSRSWRRRRFPTKGIIPKDSIPDLYWLPGPWAGRLAIMPRPRGGDWLEDEVRAWRRIGIDVVVSLLTDDEVADLGLAEEEALCRANGINFLSFPIIDRSVPASKEGFTDFIRRLADRLGEGKNIAVHCRQGIGRAGVAAICLFIESGIDMETAIERVGAVRGCNVPETSEQRLWIAEVAKSLMRSRSRAFVEVSPSK
jgi:protein-tyrosine phosphatase